MKNFEDILPKTISKLTEPLPFLLISLFLLLIYLFSDNALYLILPIIIVFPISHAFVHYLILGHKTNKPGISLYTSYLDREEREELLITGLVASILLNMVYGSGTLIGNLFLYQLTMVFTIFFGTFYLVNKYIDKASMHVGTFTIIILLVAHTINLAFGFALLLLPLIYWSRIVLKKHNWYQLMLGSVIGIAIGLLTWTIQILR